MDQAKLAKLQQSVRIGRSPDPSLSQEAVSFKLDVSADLYVQGKFRRLKSTAR